MNDDQVITVALDHEAWLRYGWEMGYCGPPICYIHDVLPLTADEEEDWGDGHDPCLHIVRLYEDHDHRLAVESNDSPTNWRASNMGWERG